MACCAASSEAISTNANPRARPVAMSRMTRTVSTVPDWLKSVSRSDSVVSYAMLPTYNLRFMLRLLRSHGNAARMGDWGNRDLSDCRSGLTDTQEGRGQK